jgi:hypothetical protein
MGVFFELFYCFDNNIYGSCASVVDNAKPKAKTTNVHAAEGNGHGNAGKNL